jgi:hypothetical protein
VQSTTTVLELQSGSASKASYRILADEEVILNTARYFERSVSNAKVHFRVMWVCFAVHTCTNVLD